MGFRWYSRQVPYSTGSHDAFVVEDVDHLLTPRVDGNTEMHRFLAVADGVVRAQGRKIIFTTNLPNIGDLDEALVRPGRCFATVRTRVLAAAEVRALLADLGKELPSTKIAEPRTLAQIYRLLDNPG